MEIKLRKNQEQTIRQTLELVDNGAKQIIIKMPTGGGKTITMEKLQEHFKNVLITTPRINLTHQTALERKGWGVIQGKNRIPTQGNVTVATLQTILNLAKRGKFNFSYYQAVFVDECHMLATPPSKNKSKRYTMGNLVEDLLSHGVTVIGFTATPYDSNGKPLKVWENAKEGTPKEWQSYRPYFKEGYLVPPILKKVGKVNADILKVSSKGDYTEESQLEAISDSQIDVVETILRYREGLTLVMAVNINHAEAIHKDLVSRGQKSIITHSKNNVEVKEAVEALKSGVVDFAVSIGTMHTGTDIPQLNTVVQACLTKSKTKRDQFAGRGARCYKDKTHFLYLDMFGTIDEIGMPFEDIDSTEEAENTKRKRRCEECGSEKPYALVKVEKELGEVIRTFKCVDCGNESVRIQNKMVETCEHCKVVQEVDEVLSFKGKAVFKCSHCNEYSFLADLTPREMVIVWENRQQAVEQIKDFATKKLKDNNGMKDRFISSFSRFSKYAQLGHLSAIMDFVGDLRATYSLTSLTKVIERMDAYTSSFKKKQSYFIDKSYQLFGECNYELEDWLQSYLREKDLNTKPTQKAILTRMKAWKLKHPISDTKKYKNLIKRFVSFLVKKRSEV